MVVLGRGAVSYERGNSGGSATARVLEDVTGVSSMKINDPPPEHRRVVEIGLLYRGTYGGPRVGVVSYERGTPVGSWEGGGWRRGTLKGRKSCAGRAGGSEADVCTKPGFCLLFGWRVGVRGPQLRADWPQVTTYWGGFV